MIPAIAEKPHRSVTAKPWVFPVLLVLVLSYAAILCTGLMTRISLGDEIQHYRFAKDTFHQKSRAVGDSLYREDDPVRIRYAADPGWSLGLSWVWRFLGGVSPVSAQVYHSLYFLMLIAGVYLIAAQLYSRETGLWSALLASTMPMFVSFGILFYCDLPATAVLTLSFFFACRRQFLAAGLLLAAGFLIKKTLLCFTPVLLTMAIVFQWPDRKKIALSSFALLAPVFLVVGIETAWQRQHFVAGRSILEELRGRFGVLFQGHRSTTSSAPAAASAQMPWLRVVKTLLTVEFSNSNFLKIQDNIKYFGAVLPTAVLFSLFKLGAKKPAWVLIFPILVYAAAVLILCLIPDIRYLMPVAPFLCVLAARALPSLTSRFLKIVLLLICTAQLFAASAYVYRERQIPEKLEEGFQFIREQIPAKSLFLSTDLLLPEYANSRFAWGYCDVRKILWGSEAERRSEMDRIQLDYIAVRKTRIYDDSGMLERHIGGYPQSFVKSLETKPYLFRIFSNEALDLWKIDRNQLKEIS